VHAAGQARERLATRHISPSAARAADVLRAARAASVARIRMQHRASTRAGASFAAAAGASLRPKSGAAGPGAGRRGRAWPQLLLLEAEALDLVEEQPGLLRRHVVC